MTDNKIVVIDEDLEDLIPGFMENRKKDVEKIRSALAGEDFVQIQSIGHSLKGVGGGYGFDDITRLGADIEQGAKDASTAAIEKPLDELANYLETIEIKFE